MQDYRKLFPLKHAKGRSFCNRVKQRERLYSEIKAGQHVLIVSPRRYGKSSLVLYTAEKYKLIYERVDLFIAIDQQAIENLILKGCKNLLNKILSPTDKALNMIKDYLKSIKLKWLVGTDGIHIEIIPERGIDSATSIMEMLKLTEVVLGKLNKTALLFIDEFQEVGKLSAGRGLEGAIRHVAEQTEHLTFVFSGSSRHLLMQMFNDRNRPLYNCCERIPLTRISADDYRQFINKIAIKTWQEPLSDDALDTIFLLTSRHPYYMNVLCRRIWSEFTKQVPSKDLIQKRWLDYVEQEIPKTSMDLSVLSTAQKKILAAISNGINKDLSTKRNLQVLDLSSGGVTKIIKTLLEKDYIESINGQYEVIDPLIKYTLKHFYGDYMRDAQSV